MLAIPGKEERQVSSLPKAANQLCWMLVTRSCLTLCDPMACSPPGSSVHGNSAGKNTGVGCHALLQGIFPTLGSNPGLSHCRRILYYLNDQGSPRILVWVAYPFSRRTSQPRNGTEVPCTTGGFLTRWTTWEAAINQLSLHIRWVLLCSAQPLVYLQDFPLLQEERVIQF